MTMISALADYAERCDFLQLQPAPTVDLTNNMGMNGPS